MGYVKDIKPNSLDSHQASPAYCLTFLRWSNRDTFNYDGSTLGTNQTSAGPLDIRTPLVVYSDAIQVNVSNSKKGLTPTVSITLKGGDINYSTAIHPGDFLIVNMLTWNKDAERIRDNALALKPINKEGDGFKGVFKVQSPVKNITTNKTTGVKTVTYTLTGAGFTEFNNVTYYNPAIVNAFAKEGTLLYQTKISEQFAIMLKTKNDINTIIKILFKILIGEPLKSDAKEIQDYGNSQFLVPMSLGKLLGKENVKYASDMYDYIIGIWKDSKQSNTSLKDGFNPSIERDGADNFYTTNSPIAGNKQVDLSNWNSNTAWSIINGYLNNTINEMYTTYRINPKGFVQPTIVVRQKPFTTNHFKSSTETKTTKFMELPRWRVSSDLMYTLQTAKNDSFRFNFVQVFTRSIPEASIKGIDQTKQIQQKNFVVDEGDIRRNGLRPYVKTANFDFPGINKPDKRLRAKEWSELLGDWIINGHLKESGNVEFYGIQESISVGDNIEIDGIIYHIESINHIMTQYPTGKKSFLTKLSISYGMDVRSSKDGPVYSNMEHTDSYTNGLEDFANEKLMPAFSDTQDIKGRLLGEEVKNTRQKSFTPTNLRKNRKK